MTLFLHYVVVAFRVKENKINEDNPSRTVMIEKKFHWENGHPSPVSTIFEKWFGVQNSQCFIPNFKQRVEWYSQWLIEKFLSNFLLDGMRDALSPDGW